MAERHKEIIMSYDKLSLASFKEALKANKYVNATGARRAVGKATTLTDSDKDKARAAIDAHFGSAPAAPAPKKAAAKKTAAAPKKAAAKKTAAAAPKKTAAAAKPPTPKKAASKKAAAAAPRAPLAGQAVGEVLGPVGHIDFENIGSIATQMKIAEKTIQNVGAALSVITQAKEKYPDAELGNVVEEMGGTLSGAVAIFQQVVNHIVKQPAATPAVKTSPAVQPTGVVNNGMPTRGESLFNESGPSGETAQTTA